MPGRGARTVIQQVRRAGGEIPRWRDLKGRYGVPAAAYDGSTTGLSADGRTLVLVELASTYPPDRTRLLVLDAPTLRHRTRLNLPGYYSVDAVSPDGRWIYLVRYTAPLRDINRYEVVAYDLLNPGAPEPIVDPEEPDEQMGGMPLSRAVSPDGRFVYTLYGAEEPFIHALDTEGRTAKCIDLPQFAGQDISSLRIGLVDGEVRLMRGAKTVAVVAKGARVAASCRRGRGAAGRVEHAVGARGDPGRAAARVDRAGVVAAAGARGAVRRLRQPGRAVVHQPRGNRVEGLST